MGVTVVETTLADAATDIIPLVNRNVRHVNLFNNAAAGITALLQIGGGQPITVGSTQSFDIHNVGFIDTITVKASGGSVPYRLAVSFD